MMEFVKRRLRAVPSPAWLTGPIFGKELRVSSRRGRSYALRFFYIALLTVFVAIVWISVVEYRGGAAFQQSRMAAAGKQIVATVVFFQFIAMQVLAIVMLSSAISDELYHRTLGLLMTTPIGSLQIVMGKVLSRLLQLVLLLAISLPILAIVRILGGVPWDYLLSGLCITLTAALFAGSVSLLLSIGNRHAYGVIVRAMFALFSFYFILPFLLAVAGYYILPRLGLRINPQSVPNLAGTAAVLASLNPFSSMAMVTQQMISPRGALPFSLPLHCGVMLGLSALVLGRCVAVVRAVALQQATGQVLEFRPRRRRKRKARASSRPPPVGPIQRVHGPPVVWKELRAPFVAGVGSRNSYIGFGIAVLALLFTYLSSADSKSLDEDFTHVMYVMLFIFIGAIVNTIFSATRITAEKESQSWSLLLTTPLSDWDILFGKAVSAFRRCVPIWGLLAGHVVLFVLVGYIHPLAIIHLAMLLAWLTCFITGAGLYFSSYFARTISAVVASFALTAGLWVLGPIVAGLLSIMGRHGNLFAKYMWLHPVFQAEMIMGGAGGVRNARVPWRSLTYGTELVFFHTGRGGIGVGRMTCTLALIAAAYTLVGLLFFWCAKRRLRRKALD